MTVNRILRTQVSFEDVSFKAGSSPPKKTVRKALKTLHTLELMAINIYKFQITNKETRHNRYLIAAKTSARQKWTLMDVYGIT